MSKKGFTLIEVTAAIAILSIIAGICFNFFNFNNRVYHSLATNVDRRANVRISLEFLFSHIRDAADVSFKNDVLTYDGKKVYIKNKILRLDTDSQQIAPYITGFNIIDLGSGLYQIFVFSDEYTLNTLVKKRKS